MNEKEEKEFKKTETLEKVLEEARHNPFTFFEQWPLDIVRRRCLEYFGWVEEWKASLVKEWINKLHQDSDDLWNELLSWYIFNCRGPVTSSHALEFAINLSKHGFDIGRIAKLVAGKLNRDQDGLYWYPPSLHEFLEKLLNSVGSRKIFGGNPYTYFLDDWHQTERAIRLILKEKDLTFLPQLREIKNLFVERKIRLSGTEADTIESVSHSAILTHAVSHLEEAFKTQCPDFNLFGSHLRERAKMLGNVNICLEYPKLVEEGENFQVLLVAETGNQEERAKLAAILPSFTVKQHVEGRHWDIVMVNSFNKGGTCIFDGNFKEGVHRFWLVIEEMEGGDSKEIFRTAGYVSARRKRRQKGGIT